MQYALCVMAGSGMLHPLLVSLGTQNQGKTLREDMIKIKVLKSESRDCRGINELELFLPWPSPRISLSAGY